MGLWEAAGGVNVELVCSTYEQDAMMTSQARKLSFFQLYINHRALTTLFLGFSSGLPYILVGSTLAAWYTKSGASIVVVGALSLVGQPYTWKLLWAPCFDRFRPLPFSLRRGWIFICQLCITACLVCMAFQNPKLHPWFLAGLAMLTALFSASQDISIDAYRIDLLSEEERGAGAAMTSLGYRIAIIVSGALALMLVHRVGWRDVYLFMALCMFACSFITLQGPEPAQVQKRPTRFKEAVIKPFLDFMQRPHAIVIVAFIITYKLSDVLALSLNTYFILHFLNFSTAIFGEVTKTAGLTGIILGSIIGGILYSRVGLFRSLLYFGILQAVAILLFAALTLVGKNISFMAFSIFSVNLCDGLSSVAFIVYLTALCNKRYTATQYALFSAIMSLGRVYLSPFAAELVKQMGWFDFYIVSFLAGFIPLAILGWLHLRGQVNTVHASVVS
ncbi:MAG: MFS transporter [Coxiella sp. (in: Bacteria)]|nr:MAG: MFS transporter [Coxiella sp. (in: g-proteobacteria)]